MGCKWDFTIKYNLDGTISRYKARLVAKRYSQTHGTFAPVAKLNTIRVLLSLATNQDWPLNQLDLNNAFLNRDLEDKLYMDVHQGLSEYGVGGTVYKLYKSLYGLKQSPRAWFERFTKVVDDIVLIGDDAAKIDRLKKSLAAEFEVKDSGSLRYFLGMEVARSHKDLNFPKEVQA